jgi:Tol biopolymer transport system component/TolB-like protein/tetratricopeptide (TPR) repeat protein
MATIYQFGKFVLNVREQSLTADGRLVHLPTKEFEILQMLVENNGTVLTKDEMMTAIWKDTFVEESNLVQYISRLRKILNVDGDQYIKTISKRGYRFSADVRTSEGDLVIERHLRVRVGAKEPRRLGEISSVAVLPFQPLASADEADFFGLGIADALITQLTRTGQIITRPTSSVMKFTSADSDPVAIGGMLNVDAILQGNFQKSGNRLRLTAQMVDSESGKPLWAESFNTEIEDIFDVQDRIAEKIVGSLSKQYSSETLLNVTKRYTGNEAAYEEYLKGRFNFAKRTPEGLTRALENFEKAIEIDPLYALAHAGMAQTYQLLPLSDELEPNIASPKAKAAVLRALQIDDAIPEAHVALGVILMDYDWNWRGAELSFQKAIELNPNYAEAHQVYGTLLLRLGRIGDAIVELKKAQRLDPLSAAINTWMGEAFAQLGENEAAIRIHQETTKFAPDYLFAYYFLVHAYVSTGRLDEAKKAAEEAGILSDDMSLTRSASIFLKVQMGERDEARAELESLVRKRDEKYVSAINIASGYSVLGDSEEAFRWLETARAERDSNLTWINVDHEFDFLREDPRFKAIVRSVNLTDNVDIRKDVPAEIAPAEPRDADPAETTAEPAKAPWMKYATAAGIIGILLVTGYYLASYFGVGEAPPAEKNTAVRLTHGPQDDAYPSFTGDGQIRFARFVDKHSLAPYIMNADGSGLREDTSIPGLSSGLWSPDGSKIFFRKGSDPDLYLANADGSGERKMTYRPGNSSWSPDSTRLVFQMTARESSVPNNSDIFIYTIATDTIEPVVESPFFDSDPNFSPDGKSVAYASDIDGNFELYTKVLATGEVRRLTNSPAHDSFPSYSPDGTQIVFNSDREKENNDVYLMNADGSGVRKITDSPGWDAAPPNTWSRDGTQLLILSDRQGPESVYIINIDPFAPELVSADIESEHPLDPSFSPDGNRIVYQTQEGIRLLDLRSEDDKFVFKTSAGGGAVISPDGQRILFLDRIDDNTELCLVNVDGSGFVNLSQSPSKEMTPSFSPDGRRIAFASNRAAGTSTFEIYVMNADGTDTKMIYGDRAMSINPTWSPDGKTIAFANDREDGRVGNFELFLIEADGGSERRITNRPMYDVDPVFSPDGSRIAFVSTADGNPEIYIVKPDGSGVLRLTRDTGRDLNPRWSPDGKRLIFTSDRSGKYRIYEMEI